MNSLRNGQSPVNVSDPSLNIITNPSLMETKPHGRSSFPLGIYLTNPYEYHDHSVNIHWHREFQLIRIIDGVVLCSAGENEFLLSEGQGLFLGSGTLHGFRAEYPALMQELIFAPEMISGSHFEIYETYVDPFLTQNISHLILNSGDPHEMNVLDLISDISGMAASSNILNRLRIQRAILELWEHMFLLLDKCEKFNRTASSHRMMIRVRQMTDFITRNYRDPITLQDISSAADIGKSEANRCFQYILRTTPVAWLVHFRLQKAKDLIETSNISIGSAAAEAGFADSNYFSRAFRKTYGVNPSDCRNKKSENLNKRKSIVTEK